MATPAEVTFWRRDGINVGWQFVIKTAAGEKPGRLTRSGESVASLISLAALVGLFAGSIYCIPLLAQRLQVGNPLDLDDFPMWFVGIAWLVVALVSIYLGIVIGQFLSPLKLRVRCEDDSTLDFETRRSAIPALSKCRYSIRGVDPAAEATLVEHQTSHRNILYAPDGRVLAVCAGDGDVPDIDRLVSANRHSAGGIAGTVLRVVGAVLLALVLAVLPFWIFFSTRSPDQSLSKCLWSADEGGTAIDRCGRLTREFSDSQLVAVTVDLDSAETGEIRRALMVSSILFRDFDSSGQRN